MRLHFTGLSHIDLPILCTHAYLHTDTHKHLSDILSLILAPLPPTTLLRSLCLSSLCVLLQFQTPELLKMYSVTVNLISVSFTDCNSEDTYQAFCFSSCLSLSNLHHPLSSYPSSTWGNKSHRQGRWEIIQRQLVMNRIEEIWQLSRLIKCMLRQTREGDR